MLASRGCHVKRLNTGNLAYFSCPLGGRFARRGLSLRPPLSVLGVQVSRCLVHESARPEPTKQTCAVQFPVDPAGLAFYYYDDADRGRAREDVGIAGQAMLSKFEREAYRIKRKGLGTRRNM